MEAQKWLCQHERRGAVGCDDVTLADAGCVTVCRYARSSPSSPEHYLRNFWHIEKLYVSHANNRLQTVAAHQNCGQKKLEC